MIVPEDVQHAMNDEPRELLSHRRAVLARIPARDVRRDVYVAAHRAACSLRGKRERDDVGRAMMAEMTRVHRRNPPNTDEGDREMRRPRPLTPQDGARDVGDPVPREGHAYRLGRNSDVMGHTDANSDVTPPLDAG